MNLDESRSEYQTAKTCPRKGGSYRVVASTSRRRCPQHFQMLKVEDGDGPDIEANESRGESVKKANRGGRSNGSYMAQ
ncbi:hypothetical protein Tco_0738243 [Tanacetum coccineum]